jgi:hypothetical protein
MEAIVAGNVQRAVYVAAVDARRLVVEWRSAEACDQVYSDSVCLQCASLQAARE